MPIPVRCACGKSIAAPDNLAGRTVKCPACSKPLEIPGKSPAEDQTKPTASSQPSKAAPPLYLTCECGRKVTAPANLAGKAVQCPTCRQLIKVPKPTVHAALTKPQKDPLSELLDEVDLSKSRTGHRCPECRQDMQPDDVLCIRCGYNIESGKKLTTKLVEGKGKKAAGHGHGPTKAAAPPKDTKTRETSPPAIKRLVKLLNLVGTGGLVLGFLIVFYLAYRTYQENPQRDIIELAMAVGASALPILGGFIFLLTVPALAAVGMLYQGQPAGRILAIIVGILAIPLAGIGALVLRGAFSDEVAEYCR